MEYGKTVDSMDRVIYRVQTNFPSAKDKRGNAEFGNYQWDTYTHKDTPGGTNPWNSKASIFKRPEYEHLLKGPERANYDTLRDHSYNDGLAFLTAERALEVAAVLREFGVLASPYEHQTDWAIPDRGLPLKVRVVEGRTASITRIVESI